MKTIGLFLVAIPIFGWFFIHYISPAIFLKVSAQTYHDIILECHQTQNALRNTQAKKDKFDQLSYRKLIRSLQVGLEYCRQQEQLKNNLLSHNVKDFDLRQIELEALGNGLLPFELLMEALGGQNEETR